MNWLHAIAGPEVPPLPGTPGYPRYFTDYVTRSPTNSGLKCHTRYPMTALFASPGNVRILRVLASDPAAQSAPQLAHRAGLSPQGVRLLLDALNSQGIVSVLGSAKSRLYVLNNAHPLAPAVRALFDKESDRWESLLEGEVARSATLDEAYRLLEELDEFAGWVEGMR